MNVRYRVEAENKKNDDSFSRHILWIISVCQEKKLTETKKNNKKERKKKIRIEHKPNWTFLTLYTLLK